MRILKKLAILGVCSFFAACAQNAKKPEKSVETKNTKKIEKAENVEKEAIVCDVGEDKRLVQIHRTTLDNPYKTKRCEVHYTKWGEQQEVAWAQATQELCPKILSNIKENIEAKGFSCKPVEPNNKTASLE
tara:strand:- start:10646 stop:11038 length:393 start_codon:yes stop_codon:yes gene_type:complete